MSSCTYPDCDCDPDGEGLGECGHKSRPPPFYSVAVYLEDLARGGPEEGGWYYNCGDIVDYVIDGIEVGDLVKLFPTEEAARAWCDQLQAKLDAGPNVGRRSISSVLSEGRYAAVMGGGLPPPHFPTVRPHYE